MRLLSFAALLALTLTGCMGLDKRGDAINAPVADARETVRKLAHSMEIQSSVARSSGQGTLTRLSALFPTAGGVLPPIDFAFEGASGLNRAFGQGSRPFESLAQMALRAKASTLCTDFSTDTATGLFKLDTKKSLLEGETPPTDAAERLALAAVRNAWLHPYLASDKEVQAIAALYKEQVASSDEGGESGGRKAVCMAVLLAPQFWMGAPESTDSARRVSLEFFRRIPTMQELKDFADKKVTIDKYFDTLLADTKGHAGFVATIHQWHEEWLGLRDFLGGGLYGDRRQGPPDVSGGASNLMGISFAIGAAKGGESQSIGVGSPVGHVASQCLTSDAQAFDPDTNMIAWEHYNYDTKLFDFVGGWIRTGSATLLDTDASENTMSTADTLAALRLIGSSPNADDATAKSALKDVCGKAPARFAIKDQKGVYWRLCNGLLSLNAHGADMEVDTMKRLMEYVRIYDGYSKETTITPYPMSVYCTKAKDIPACIAYYQKAWGNSRNAFIADLRQLVERTKSYNGTGQVKATIHDTFATVAGQAGDFYANFMARITDFDGLIDALRTSMNTGPWYYETDLGEMKMPVGGLAGGKFYYNLGPFDRFSLYLGGDGRNRMLPLHPPGTIGFAQGDRRVRRFGGSVPHAWQDGWDTARLWYTGGRVAVCNNAERLVATCFMRPKAVGFGGADPAGYRADRGSFWFNQGAWTPDSVMHPAGATSYYCGQPDPGSIATFNAADPNGAYASAKGLNPLTVNIDLRGSAGVSTVTTPAGTEVAAFVELVDQLKEEPYKLIEHLILEKGDYRELLTADYTYGSSCLKFFYDTQGYYLPTHPDAAGGRCRPGTGDAKFSAGAGIPIGHLSTVSGTYEDGSNARSAIWKKAFGGPPAELPPRVYAGILTMPAFVAPVATKARGIAARYFARLLCQMPNWYDPEQDADSSAKVALHKSFISHRKHLQAECFQCHRNLDPLSAAISWSFQGLLTTDAKTGEQSNAAGGEGSAYDFTGELDYVELKRGAMAGLRHGGSPKSRGAFMGQEVLGIADLGKKVADSRTFAECVVNTTFQNVFGRQVQFADAKFFKALVDEFTDPKGVDYRYVDLLKLMIQSENYQRKN